MGSPWTKDDARPHCFTCLRTVVCCVCQQARYDQFGEDGLRGMGGGGGGGASGFGDVDLGKWGEIYQLFAMRRDAAIDGTLMLC